MDNLSRRAFLTGAAATAGLALLPKPSRAGNRPVKMRDLYNKDLSYSDRARAWEDTRISVSGYMAPPLKAESTFFVLTKRPMSVCPFCETEAEWPDDILAVYTKRIFKVVGFNVPIIVHGILKLSAYKDPETGFVSRVRLVDSSYEKA